MYIQRTTYTTNVWLECIQIRKRTNKNAKNSNLQRLKLPQNIQPRHPFGFGPIGHPHTNIQIQSIPSNHKIKNNTEKKSKRTGSAVRRPSHASSVTAKSKKAKATGVTAAHEGPRQTAVVRATEGRAVSGQNQSPDRTQKGRKKGEHRQKHKHRQRTNGQRRRYN